MLAVHASREPAMIVPILERPDAEASPAAAALSLHDWTDGSDPYAATAALLDAGRALRDLRLGLGDAPARPPARRCPSRATSSMTSALPMLRAVKGDDELERLAAAGAAADASLEEIVGVRFAGRTEREIAADLAGFLRKHGHSQVDFTVVGSGPERRQPAPRDGRPGRSRRATWSSSTSAASRTATARTRRAPSTSASRPTRSARSSRSSAAPSRPASRPCARASPARRSTAPRAR